MYAGTFKEAKNPSYRFSNEKIQWKVREFFFALSERKLLVKLVERPDFQKLCPNMT